MSNPVYEISFIYPAAKEGGKDSWQRVGALWPTQKGDGFTGTMELLGQRVRIAVMPPKPRDGFAATPNNSKPAAAPKTAAPMINDDIPF